MDCLITYQSPTRPKFWARKFKTRKVEIIAIWAVLRGPRPPLKSLAPGPQRPEVKLMTQTYAKLHRVSKKLCKVVFVRTSSNFLQFW